MAVVSRPVTAGKTNKGGLVRDVMLKTPFKIQDFQWNMDSWKEVRTCVFARPGARGAEQIVRPPGRVSFRPRGALAPVADLFA